MRLFMSIVVHVVLSLAKHNPIGGTAKTTSLIFIFKASFVELITFFIAIVNASEVST